MQEQTHVTRANLSDADINDTDDLNDPQKSASLPTDKDGNLLPLCPMAKTKLGLK